MNATQSNKKASKTRDAAKTPVVDATGAKKKKSRYFETYISKLLKNVSEKNGITSNAKQQLNSVLCILAQRMCDVVLQLTSVANKKTVSVKEVENAVRVMFNGELAKNSLQEGHTAVEKYGDNEDTVKGASRQDRAGILFPPSITDKFIRHSGFGYAKIMITSSAPVFMAAVLEYLTAELLDMSATIARDNKRVRITIRDLEMSVRTDNEFNTLFNTYNLEFLGGGVVPFIHESLLAKKPRKKGRRTTDDTKKTHRFRPGTVALRDIRRYQKTSNVLTFAKCPFERMVRAFIKEHNESMKISKEVFTILQHFMEQYLVGVLRDANMAAIHAGRVKLMQSDIQFVLTLRKRTLDSQEGSLPYEAPEDEGEIVDEGDEEEVETEAELSDDASE